MKLRVRGWFRKRARPLDQEAAGGSHDTLAQQMNVGSEATALASDADTSSKR